MDDECVSLHILLLGICALKFLFGNYSSCNVLIFGSKTPRPSHVERQTYGTAQKMCASMTYIFGCTYDLGSMHWQCGQVDGSMVGNPSISEAVS
jgi:hypothetical protein